MSALSELLQAENTKGLSARAISQAARGLGFTLNHDTAARYLRGEHGRPDEATLLALSKVLESRWSKLRRAASLPAEETEPYRPPAEATGSTGGSAERWTRSSGRCCRHRRPAEPVTELDSRRGREPTRGRQRDAGLPSRRALIGASPQRPAGRGVRAARLRRRPRQGAGLGCGLRRAARGAAGIVGSPAGRAFEPLVCTTCLHTCAAAGELSRTRPPGPVDERLSELLQAANTDGLSARSIARKARAGLQPQPRHGCALPARGPRQSGRGHPAGAVQGAQGADGQAATAAALPDEVTEPYRPPAEASRLNRRQRRAVDEIIRAMLEAEPGQQAGDRTGHARAKKAAPGLPGGATPNRPNADAHPAPAGSSEARPIIPA